MSKIKVLSDKMTKLISAGEVVEKPASIIKELIENSIDAGATNITVEIFNGGQSKICISDNGCGMTKEDIQMCVLPHATSKVSQPDDLNAIATLGFRGEALSSICAVSMVNILSKTSEQEFGYMATVDEGKITNLTEVNCQNGTRMEISNLFYNTPARLKFLRKPKSDEADITDYVEKLMLAYSNIGFKYVIDGKIKYNTFGSGLLDNIYTIYGKDVCDNVVPVQDEKDGYKLFGYIGVPQIAKPNRNYQTLLVSGRYVKNNLISSAISAAFENYLMKGRFPFYVLFLDVPLDCVDVNIHPSKMEVKFERTGFIYSFIQNAISNILLEINYQQEIPLTKQLAQDDKIALSTVSKDVGISFGETENSFHNQNGENQYVQNPSTQTITNQDIQNFNSQGNINQNTQNLNAQSNTNQNDNKNQAKTNFDVLNLENLEGLSEEEKMMLQQAYIDSVVTVDLKSHKFIDPDIKFTKPSYFDEIEAQEKTSEENQSSQHSSQEVDIICDQTASQNIGNKTQQKIQMQQSLKFENYKIVGVAFDTYILIEMDKNLYFIDQHAGHERVLFDKFMNEISNQQIAKQDMLFPYVFELKNKEFNKMLDALDILKNIGFEIGEFGQNSFKIDSVPVLLQSINLKDFIDQIISEDFNAKSSTDIIRNKIASHACKSAVKAGDKLSESEIDVLVQNITNGVLLCPHGRPFVMKMSNNQLEKWFGRKE